MRIAVLHHGDDITNDYAAYLSALLDETAAANNYTVTDYDALKRDAVTELPENLVMHIVTDAGSNLALQYWYRVKLPHILARYKTDIVVSMYGIAAETNIPQLIILPDIAYNSYAKNMPAWRQFAAKRLPKSLSSAKQVIVYSAHAQQAVTVWNATLTNKTYVIPYTANAPFKNLEWHDKLYVKSRFAENREYFVAVLPDDDETLFTNLLQSFSKFKKWQQSSMQLILLPKEEGFTPEIDGKLKTYKYRNDVKLVNDADKKETADIIATAYAMVHLHMQDADILPVTAAMQCGTPIIGFYTESMEEYCGEAALMLKEKGSETLGDALIRLYKDENLRGKMSDAAIARTASLQQEQAAGQLWQLVHAGSI